MSSLIIIIIIIRFLYIYNLGLGKDGVDVTAGSGTEVS